MRNLGMEATSLTYLSINSSRADLEPAFICSNRLSYSSFEGGGLRERAEINLPIGSSELIRSLIVVIP